jgi:hypothetical protein
VVTCERRDELGNPRRVTELGHVSRVQHLQVRDRDLLRCRARVGDRDDRVVVAPDHQRRDRQTSQVGRTDPRRRSNTER